MWDTNTDNWGNADPGTTPVFSYVDALNEEADVGGQIGVINRKFGGEGTGQQIQVPLPSFHIIFSLNQYFSVVNIFQGWMFFSGEYFEGVNIFQP